MKITVLGCGASSGVPLIGCVCNVCASSNPKNKRSRVSIIVESATTRILVDTSPDLRQQALDNNIREIDAIIYTHAHADHVHGIDDVRSFNYAKNDALNIYGDKDTLKNLQERFSYCFLPANPERTGWFRPCLIANEVEAEKKITIGDIDIMPFNQKHGKGKTLGLRFGKFAYSTDVNFLDDQALLALAGIDVWLVDCLRYNQAPTHAHLDLTLNWISQVNPRQAYLTHMSHEFDYEELKTKLPENILPAYDGLVVDLE